MNFNCMINKFVCTQFVHPKQLYTLTSYFCTKLNEWLVGWLVVCAMCVFFFHSNIINLGYTIPRWKWKRRSGFYYRWPGNVWNEENEKGKKGSRRENYELIIRYSVCWCIGSTNGNGIHFIDFPIWKMEWQINCYAHTHKHTRVHVRERKYFTRTKILKEFDDGDVFCVGLFLYLFLLRYTIII